MCGHREADAAPELRIDAFGAAVAVREGELAASRRGLHPLPQRADLDVDLVALEGQKREAKPQLGGGPREAEPRRQELPRQDGLHQSEEIIAEIHGE